MSCSGAATCVGGRCSACTPGATQCSGNGVQTCAKDGTWGPASACGEPCVAGKCEKVSAIVAGGKDTCAITTSGAVECWGDNTYGQLGTTSIPNSFRPILVPGLSGTKALAVGPTMCAITASDALECWGYNGDGEFGNNTSSKAAHPTPVAIPGMTNVSSIAVGSSFVCAVQAVGGTIYCWGATALGNGSTGSSWVPVKVSNISNASQVTAGGNHACALLPSGLVQCWGFNAENQLGNGVPGDSAIPVQVVGLKGVTMLQAASGGNHTCAVIPSTSSPGHQPPPDLFCWGADSLGQLGDGSTGTSSPPVGPLRYTTTALALGSIFTCIADSGFAECFGDGTLGEMGNGSSMTVNSSPTEVSNLTNVTSVAAGSDHACALSGGTVSCWGGSNADGELGIGTDPSAATSTPTPVLW